MISTALSLSLELDLELDLALASVLSWPSTQLQRNHINMSWISASPGPMKNVFQWGHAFKMIEFRN